MSTRGETRAEKRERNRGVLDLRTNKQKQQEDWYLTREIEKETMFELFAKPKIVAQQIAEKTAEVKSREDGLTLQLKEKRETRKNKKQSKK